MFDDFRKFVMRGNVIDLAIGIVIGSTFGAISRSLVDDILMPPIGLLLGNVDFSNLFILLRPGPEGPATYVSLAEAQAAGAVTINYGLFINTIVSFLIVALAMFLVITFIARMQKKFEREEELAAPITKECEYCYSNIPIKAVRCPECTSSLQSAPV